MPEDVNGIQSDDIGTATAAHTDKIVQIGKIADSPITAAAQRIQLNAETPQLFFVKAGQPVTFVGRNRKQGDEGTAGGGQLGIIVTDFNIGSNFNFQLLVLFAGNNATLGKREDNKGNIAFNAGLAAGQRQAEIALGFRFRNHRIKNLVLLQNHIHRLQNILPTASVQRPQRTCHFAGISGLKAQHPGKKSHRVFADLMTAGF